MLTLNEKAVGERDALGALDLGCRRVRVGRIAGQVEVVVPVARPRRVRQVLGERVREHVGLLDVDGFDLSEAN